MKILIVDDSKTMRRIIMGIAKTIGYETIEANNGNEALKVLNIEYADVAAITLDVNMPELSGMDCLKEIKNDSRFKEIPVVMVTTEAEKQTILDAIRLGAKQYVTKPFRPEEITTRLMEAIGIDDEF